MITTHRCRHCGQVLEAFVEFAPGIPQAVLQRTSENRIRDAQIRHAERCAGRAAPSRVRRPARPAKPRTALTARLGLAGLWRRGEALWGHAGRRT